MLLIENIGILVTLADSTALGAIDNDAALVIDDDIIVWAGFRREMPAYTIRNRIDACGNVVIPGLIDCHSHLMFAGSRPDEFARRMGRESYESIMAKGGGIMSTVAKTRAARDDELLDLARARADAILAGGVTTLEAKSGYGLSVHDELRLLRLMKQLHQDHALDIHASFLGAHVVPTEYKERRSDYVAMVLDEMLPIIADEKLAVDCDVFCEQGALSVLEARRILQRAYDLGLGLRAHVHQLGLSGGVSLVRDLPLKSVSHADYLDDDDIAVLAAHDVVVEALPFAALFLKSKTVLPAQKLMCAGIPLAIATDFNPGSAMCHDLFLAARLAVTYLGFSLEEALRAITINAAKALGNSAIGVIKPGAIADILISNCTSISELFYDWTKQPARIVIKRGKIVSQRRAS